MTIARRPTAEVKADRTTAAARSIIDAEKKVRDANTARLKAARLAKEAEELLAHAPGKPRARALKSRAAKV
jgi:hypothetical protein